MRNKFILLLLCTALLGWGAKIEIPKDFTAIFEGCYIELNWSKVKNAIAYEVYRKIDMSDFQLLAKTKDSFYIDNDLDKGGMYTYKLSAVSTNNKSPDTKAIQLYVAGKLVESIEYTAAPLELTDGDSWHEASDISYEHYENVDYSRQASGKPNIYLYPEQKTRIKLSLKFPKGGHVTVSDPDYGNGWDVLINPDGTFEAEGKIHNFLFYESDHPKIFSSNKGYVIAMDDLESFFRDNMSEIGFVGQEIEDFIEFWIPRLKFKPYFEIKPIINGALDGLIDYDINVEPDTTIRLIYMIKGLDDKSESVVEEPRIVKKERKGFVASEWGVIVDGLKLR